MTDDSPGALSRTLIGGASGIEDELGADVTAVSDDLDIEVSENREIFKDISETLEPSNSYLSKIVLSGRDLYVPGFQRKYSWDDTNHNEFWSSLTDLYSRINSTELEDGKISLWSASTDERLEEFYFGTIYLAESRKEDGEEIFEVIDGQQRLTTVFIILNEVRKLLESYENDLRESDDFSAAEADGVETLRMGIISQFLYTNMAHSGSGDHSRLRLTDHDDPFFRMILEDRAKNVLKIASGLQTGSFPHWRKISNIIDKLDMSIDGDELEVSEIDDELDLDDVGELLSQSKQFTESQEYLLEARNTYKEYIQNHLDTELGLSEGAYKQRSLALLNLSIILITSFRIVQCKFREPVDKALKIDVFQSLNETGKELEIHDKINARVVAVFGIDSEEVNEFEELIEDFGGKEKKIQKYLTNYIIAIEDDNIYDKGTVEDNLLDIFNTQEGVGDISLQSRLTNESEGSEFILNLCSNADKFRTIDGEIDLKADFFENESVRSECQNILNDLPGDQWKPFVLLMYIKLSEEEIDPEFFKTMLELVEKFMLRNSFASGAATAIDRTFIAACVRYNNEELPDFSSIPAYEDQDWTDDIDSFGSRTRDIMEAHMVNNSSWNALSGSQLVRNLHDPNWSNPKSILKKLARYNTYSGSERGRSGAIEAHKRIDFSNLEREHILPRNPKIEGKEYPYSWYRDFFQIDEDNPPREEVQTVFESLIEADDHEDEKYKRLNRLSSAFIDDIGNSILLQNSLNNAIQNRQFSIKLLSYYLRSFNDLDDFGEYISDIDKLDLDTEDIVKLVECFGNSLSSGEEELLLYEVERITPTIGIEDINRIASEVSLDSESPTDESVFISRFSSVTDFFDEFDLVEDDHQELHEEWSESTIEDLTESEGDGPENLGLLLDASIESVLSKIAAENDETGSEHAELCGSVSGFESIVSKVNKSWNWERVIERKVSLITEIKSFVELHSIDDEFREYDDESSYHRERVEEAIKY